MSDRWQLSCGDNSKFKLSQLSILSCRDRPQAAARSAPVSLPGPKLLYSAVFLLSRRAGEEKYRPTTGHNTYKEYNSELEDTLCGKSQ